MTMWIEMKRHFKARALEWFDGLYLFGWGAYVTLHPGMFDSGKTGLSFSAMNGILPQEVWGFCATLIGMVKLAALFINGQWGITPFLRIVTSFFSILVWFLVSVGLARAGIPQTGLIVYPGFVMANLFTIACAAADAYEGEAMRRLSKLSERNASDVIPLARRG